MKPLPSFLFTLLLINSNCAHCQKIVTAKGIAQIKIEKDWSYNFAKSKVRGLSKINAIENAFGTYVEQESNISVEDGKSHFKIIGSTKVKADWLETTSEEFIENAIEVEDTDSKSRTIEIWLTCNIKGKIREIKSPKIFIDAFSLNCPSINCKTTRFSNGDQFYLSFKAPVNGYLSVFMIESQEVYRLLPYSEMNDFYINAVPIIADKEYVFFSQSENHDYFLNFDKHLVDEIEMSTNLQREYLQLNIIFSTEPFTKPILGEGIVSQNAILPKTLTKAQFDNWFIDNRIYNTTFYYDIINLEINKK